MITIKIFGRNDKKECLYNLNINKDISEGSK